MNEQASRGINLSTTLATNAVVEGMGGRVGLIMIGFEPSALERNNLGQVINEDPVIFVSGGHKSDAKPQAKLDFSALDDFIETHRDDQCSCHRRAFCGPQP